MIAWVIGGGGLLGAAITRRLRSAGWEILDAPAIPWAHQEDALAALTHAARMLHERAGRSPWLAVWAAGRASTATTPSETARELATFTHAIDAIRANRPLGSGSVVVCSSAGGVYAASLRAPFTDTTQPRAAGLYGQLKLDQEDVARDLLTDTAPLLIARISNVYGPGQDLTKLQGIVSRLCLSAVTREPVSIFVSLDTVRDYITADDAARRIVHWSDVARDDAGAGSIRVIASGSPTSLGALIRMSRNVTRARIPIALTSHESALAQASDLRLIPSTDSATAAMPLTPLPAGIREVYLDIARRYALASFTSARAQVS